MKSQYTSYILAKGTYPGDGSKIDCTYQVVGNKGVNIPENGPIEGVISKNNQGPGFFFNQYSTFNGITASVYQHLVGDNQDSRALEWERIGAKLRLTVYQKELLSECKTINQQMGRYSADSSTTDKILGEGSWVLLCGDELVRAKLVPSASPRICPVGYWSPKQGNVEEVYKIEDVLPHLRFQRIFISQFDFGETELTCGHAALVPQVFSGTVYYRDLKESFGCDIDFQNDDTREKLKQSASEAIFCPLSNGLLERFDYSAFWWRFARNTVLFVLFFGIVAFEVVAGVFKWETKLFGLLHTAPVWLVGLVVGIALLTAWSAYTYNQYNLDVSRGFLPARHSLELIPVARRTNGVVFDVKDAHENGNGNYLESTV